MASIYLLILLLLLAAAFLFPFRIRAALADALARDDNDAPVSGEEFGGVHEDEKYLKESIRLAEKWLDELIATIVSCEKKSLAIAAAGVYFANQFLSAECGADAAFCWIARIGMFFAALSVAIAGVVACTTAKLGTAGAPAAFSLRYWNDLQKSKDARAAETKAIDDVQYLQLQTLERYREGIIISERSHTRKHAGVTLASYCLLIASIAFVFFLFLK